MAEVDIETYNSLKWVIDNDPEDLCLTFSAQEDKLGQVQFDGYFQVIDRNLKSIDATLR